MREDGVYILNPAYGLKRDNRRVVLFNRDHIFPSIKGISEFLGFIHPLYGIMLALFDGKKKYKEVAEDINKILHIEHKDIKNIISPLIENNEELKIFYDNHCFSFPRRTLVEKGDGIEIKQYNIEDFLIPKKDLDLSSWRFYSPLDVIFMINTKCHTDCIYCYANRKKIDRYLPIERLKEIIEDAKKIGIRSFDISGGEFFLHPNWHEILKYIVTKGFTPYISTKIPLSPGTIRKLKDTGISRLQISIDSIIKEELMEILNVKEQYYYRLLESLSNLDDIGIDLFFNTQICSINIKNIDKLIDYLLKLKSIKRMNLGAAGYSLYKSEEEYLRIRPSLDEMKRVEEKIDTLTSRYRDRININFSGYNEKSGYNNNDKNKKREKFSERARCSANFYAFVILPDGKVTICEELYWHPRFIIGDLTKQSIEEVWNSKKAIELYQLSKDMFRDASACKDCEEFDNCRKTKGVCWKEILYAYGDDNWDYPDPKCQRAPTPSRTFYLE